MNGLRQEDYPVETKFTRLPFIHIMTMTEVHELMYSSFSRTRINVYGSSVRSRKSHWRYSMKKIFLEILQNSLENLFFRTASF